MSDPDTRAAIDIDPLGRHADDQEALRMVAETIGKAPTLRPRMIRLLDEDGTIQRVNLGKIVRWHPTPPSETGILVVRLDDGMCMRIPDPHGQVDEALCSAFYDLTAADLT